MEVNGVTFGPWQHFNIHHVFVKTEFDMSEFYYIKTFHLDLKMLYANNSYIYINIPYINEMFLNMLF